MSRINPGELKDVIKILENSNTDELDENGFPAEKFVEKYKLRCKKKTVSTREFIGAGREISELTYKFICRKREIDNKMLVEYKNQKFDIKHVHEIDEHFIELTAVLSEV